MTVFSSDQLTEYFVYLDDLRESGETNMFGAAPWLAAAYDLGNREAREVLKLWMDTFSEKPPETRAQSVAM